MSHEIPNLKVVTYALGLQKSAVGCQIFALSAALKSYKWEKEGGNNLEDFAKRDAYELEEDKDAKYIPPYFFKHAHSRSSVTRIAENPRHKEWAKHVSKKEEKKWSLLKRHNEYRVTQCVTNLDTGKVEEKRFSNSIVTVHPATASTRTNDGMKPLPQCA